jgi:alkaline phosphatase D
VCTPDDHEVDNYAGLNEELPQDGGSGTDPEAFRQRRTAAYQAYYEHLPLRIDQPSGGDDRIYRDLAWGSLARFYVLDTRQYRSDQACARPSDLGAPCPASTTRPARCWETSRRRGSVTRSRRRTPRGTCSPSRSSLTRLALVPGTDDLFNLDRWDGYPASRQRVIDRLRGVANPVVITGDIHLSGLGVVTQDGIDPTTAPVATELVGTSISSSFPAAFVDAIGPIATASPAIHYAEAVDWCQLARPRRQPGAGTGLRLLALGACEC